MTATTPPKRAPAHDRIGLPAPPGGVPRHLDLEDPLPRGPGAAGTEAHPRRVPPVQRGGCRAARDDPPAPARRVPASARDPPGAGHAARGNDRRRRRLGCPRRSERSSSRSSANVPASHGSRRGSSTDYGLLEPPLRRGRRRHCGRVRAARRARGCGRSAPAQVRDSGEQSRPICSRRVVPEAAFA